MQAGEFDEQPTCGWFYLAGAKVPESQGFSCQCSAGQIWDDTFGSNKQRT